MTTDPNHERVKQLTIHPVWCTPLLCTAPAYEMTTDEYKSDERNRAAEHVSQPVQLAEGRFDWRVPEALTKGDVCAWLTRAVAPWQCETYLRVGAWMGPGKEMRPLSIFSLPLSPKHRISAGLFAMSGGERLAHLIEYGFAELGYPATPLFAAIEPEGANDAGA